MIHWVFSLLLLFSSPIEAAQSTPDSETTVDKNKIGFIELIAGKKNVEVLRNNMPVSAGRGTDLHYGDKISSGNETIYLQLLNYDEIQITPHTTIIFEHSDPATEGTTLKIKLEKGLIWCLIANGFSLASPLIVYSPNVVAGIPAANFVMEHIENGKTSILTLEGTLRYSKKIQDLNKVKKSFFLRSPYRVHIDQDKASDAQRFKRNILISYLNRRAKVTAQDMANRGAYILGTIARKGRKTMDEDAITWNTYTAPPTVFNTGAAVSAVAGPAQAAPAPALSAPATSTGAIPAGAGVAPVPSAK